MKIAEAVADRDEAAAMHQRERGKRREIHNKLMELQARRRALVSHARPLGDIMSTVGSRCKQCVVCTGPQGNIRVVCRARPLVAVEIKSGEGVDVTSYPEGACVRVAGASRVDWFCANSGVVFFRFARERRRLVSRARDIADPHRRRRPLRSPCRAGRTVRSRRWSIAPSAPPARSRLSLSLFLSRRSRRVVFLRSRELHPSKTRSPHPLLASGSFRVR